jgi:tRNA (guanine37-N1)-methyltransferase
MRFDIVTIFPEFFGGPLDYGIVRRALELRLIEAHIHDLRDFTHDRHRTVDDRPFGGGEGMVLKPEPLFEAVEALLGGGSPVAPPGTAVVLLSASGKLFRQEKVRQFARLEQIILLCGRYEGVDERVADHLATDEVSIGDFVLSGGELPAAMIVDGVTRLLPGALGNESSTVNESFSAGSSTANAEALALERNPSQPRQGPTACGPKPTLPIESQAKTPGPHAAGHGILDYPHYTRPPSYRSWDVPEVLMSGHHEGIRRWRREKALEKTFRNRPDLLEHAVLQPEDLKFLKGLNLNRE